MKVHSRIGPGCSEPIYRDVMYHSLTKDGFTVEREKRVTFEFEGVQFRNKLRADLIIEGRLVVELKSQKRLTQVDERQLLTYMRLLQAPMGLLLNFGALHLRDGVKRILNNYSPSFP